MDPIILHNYFSGLSAAPVSLGPPAYLRAASCRFSCTSKVEFTSTGISVKSTKTSESRRITSKYISNISRIYWTICIISLLHICYHINTGLVLDALDRSRCLGILEGYGVGPSPRRLLHNYWRRLTMAARAGGYYGKAFKGERGVTQGDPLSPTIFNVLVDAVVRHWLEVLKAAKEEKGAKGGGGDISWRHFTRMTEWSARRTPNGSRALSAPW